MAALLFFSLINSAHTTVSVNCSLVLYLTALWRFL